MLYLSREVFLWDGFKLKETNKPIWDLVLLYGCKMIVCENCFAVLFPRVGFQVCFFGQILLFCTRVFFHCWLTGKEPTLFLIFFHTFSSSWKAVCAVELPASVPHSLFSFLHCTHFALCSFAPAIILPSYSVSSSCGRFRCVTILFLPWRYYNGNWEKAPCHCALHFTNAVPLHSLCCRFLGLSGIRHLSFISWLFCIS